MLRALVVCVLPSISLCAVAQTQPTPIEAKAAYCLIINANALAIQKKLLASLPADDIETRKQAQLPVDETSLRITRIEGYLAPRVPRLDQIALTAAQRQADDDLKTLSSQSVRMCTEQCGGLPQTEDRIAAYAACTAKCAPEPLTRVRACTDLAWLPQ
ncbi:MAG TPA: hypothetical protein VL424_12715 [Pararobbsia sp.]|nr:hypothetical protein [Pararobbsia sp.]